MAKDRCEKRQAHDWYLTTVKDGLGTYECRKCGGHKWAYAYGYYGEPLSDGEYGPLHMGALGPVQRSLVTPANKTPVKKLTEEEKRVRRNEQARRRRALAKSRAETARLRFGAF